jgi:hypothetical protein
MISLCPRPHNGLSVVPMDSYCNCNLIRNHLTRLPRAMGDTEFRGIEVNWPCSTWLIL